MNTTVILGAGVTGLAAALQSHLPAYERSDRPGGICSSYYISPNNGERRPDAPADGEAYRFEIGGGHWIFGGDPFTAHFIDSIAPVRPFVRKSEVFFPESGLTAPYPLQNHLSYLGPEVAVKALAEMIAAQDEPTSRATFAEWLEASFGKTLCDLFFHPFHQSYTAGLWTQIAPQDAYKSPVDLAQAIRGAFGDDAAAGYNTTFLYPIDGLGALAQRMASRAEIHYGTDVARIDVKRRQIEFADGSGLRYENVLSTLPLNNMMGIARMQTDTPPAPFTSVLVLNIGARKGPRCPSSHWLYVPRSMNGFHRVGVYSNVDVSFLPASTRKHGDRVSLYVEKAYSGGARPTDEEIEALCVGVASELREWGWITEVEVIDPTWIEVAYTWSWPDSSWRSEALQTLHRYGIHQIGRYGRWAFQGIRDSIREGFVAGSAFASSRQQ